MFISGKISLKKDSSDPVYMQLYRELIKQIRAHNPDESDVFPSERTLCAELGMHRATVDRAYEELVRTGVALRQQDKTLVLSRSARTKLEGYVPSIGILLPELFSLFVEKKERTGIQYIKGIFDHAARLNYAVSVIPLPPPYQTAKSLPFGVTVILGIP